MPFDWCLFLKGTDEYFRQINFKRTDSKVTDVAFEFQKWENFQ